MKWNQISKRLIPSFLKRKREEKPMSKGMDHLLYEFSVNPKNSKVDVDSIRKVILMNPWSLLSKPSIIFNENSDDKSMVISFHVLSKDHGREIERMIFDTLK